MPNISAPTGRMASVAVTLRTMSRLGTWKCAARVSKRKTTTKKSKASSVQPRKPAAMACQRSEAVVDGWARAGNLKPRLGANLPNATYRAITALRQKHRGPLVPKKGLEPPHPCGYMDLNHARLPIPPLRHECQ